MLEVFFEGEGMLLFLGLIDFFCVILKVFFRVLGESFWLMILICGIWFGVVEWLVELIGVVGWKLVILILVILVGEVECLIELVGGLLCELIILILVILLGVVVCLRLLIGEGVCELIILILVIWEGVVEVIVGGDGECEWGFMRIMIFGGEGLVGVFDWEFFGVD